MRLGSIFYTLGYGGAMLALAMLLPLSAALYGDHATHTQNFIIGFLLMSFASGAMLLSGTATRARVLNLDLLLIMILFWTLLPLIATIPMIGALQIDNFVGGYFETISALTTSGATILSAPQIEAAPILLWRALLAWLGGLWITVFGVAVIAPFAVGGVTLSDNPLLRHDEVGDTLERLARPLRLIFPIYAGASALGVLALWISGMPLFDAFCMALAAISTTGFSLDNSGLWTLYPLGAQMVLATLSFVGALSMPLLVLVMLGGVGQGGKSAGKRTGKSARGALLFRNAEARVFVLLIAVYALLSYWFFYTSEGIIASVLQAISLGSTAGFHFVPTQDVPLIWLLALPIIGGCALSTAGGIKIVRVLILGKGIGRDLRRLIHPSLVHATRVDTRRLDGSDFAAAWAFLSIFLLLMMVGLLLVSLFGLPFEQAWAVVVTALTNSGAVLHADMVDFATTNDGVNIITALLMIMGRIDFPMALVLFTASFRQFIR